MMLLSTMTGLLLVLIITCTGSQGLSDSAFQLLTRSDGARSSQSSVKYELAASHEVVDHLVDEIVSSKLYDEEEMGSWLRDLKDELGQEARRSKQRSGLEEQANGDPSWWDKGLGFIKGLLGGDNPEPDDSGSDTSTPSPDDQSIIDDIERYLDHVVDNKNGTLDRILRYLVNYVHRNVHFWLFTRRVNGYEDLTIGKTSNLSNSDFNDRKRTIILIHGWITGGDNAYSKRMINAFDNLGDFNIISVDWSELSYNFYTISRVAVNFVGPYVAKMIEFLTKHHDVQLAELHVLGHSLGAHIAGIAGMFVKNGKIGRITGFDPASPLFGNDQKYRLDASDAKFVDVIHTSLLGMSEPLGHADFYPNGGGPSQPGCGLNIVCPHRRSYQYFISSMTDNNFLAFSCNSWSGFTAGNCSSHYVHMGLRLTRRSRGKFYLRTSAQAPFALGMKTLDPVVQPTSDPSLL